MSKTTMINQAPDGWINVVPACEKFDEHLARCIQLFAGSTAKSGINAISANPTVTATFVQEDIQFGRIALWLKCLKDQGGDLALAFYSLDGPTSYPARCPKFLVDAGISRPIYDTIAGDLSKHDAYRALRAAVAYFSTNNIKTARLYVWIEGTNPPIEGDLIKPIFDYVIKNERDGDPESGVLEDYSNQTTIYAGERWCKKLTTWKLRSC